MLVEVFLLLFLFILLLVVYDRKNTAWQNPPPGPPAHPIIGCIPTMAQQEPIGYKAFGAISKAYGPVLKMILGFQKMCLISGLPEMTEVFNNPDLDDRFESPTTHLVMTGETSITYSSPLSFLFPNHRGVHNTKEKVRELRRFTLRTLRDLGFARAASEDSIQEEAAQLVNVIKKKVDQSNGIISLELVFNCAALNVIWNLIAAKKYSYDDTKMGKLIEYVGNFMLLGKDVIGKVFGLFPILRFIPPYKETFRKRSEGMAEFRNFIVETIETRKSEMDSNDPACFIDTFLNMIPNDSTGIYTENQLITTCIDLFLAGSETTSKSLQYGLVFMIHYPEVQRKVHEELDRLTGGAGGTVKMSDRPNLPYVDSTLSEIFRAGHIVPITPLRRVTKAFKVGAYSIPPDTAIGYNTFNIHMDAQHWGDPENFRPERFLENGCCKKDDHLLPFGIGRRKCLGESLARMENFLFFSNIMLNYKFEKAGDELPSLSPEEGFTNAPPPFLTKVTKRY